MPLPRWIGHINKRTFNKREVRQGTRPVLIHVGRSSGKTYETPLDAHRIENGFIFFPLYGPDSDWVKNVLTAGTANLRYEGDEFELVSPRLISPDDARRQLPGSTKPPPGFMRIADYLQMDLLP